MQRALADYNRNSTLKHMINKIRRDALAFERLERRQHFKMLYFSQNRSTGVR